MNRDSDNDDSRTASRFDEDDNDGSTARRNASTGKLFHPPADLPDNPRIDPRVMRSRRDQNMSQGLGRADARIQANRARQEAQTGRTNRGLDTAEDRIERNRERNMQGFDDRFDDREGAGLTFDDMPERSVRQRNRAIGESAFNSTASGRSRTRNLADRRFDRTADRLDDDSAAVRRDLGWDGRTLDSQFDDRFGDSMQSMGRDASGRVVRNRGTFNDRTGGIGRGLDIAPSDAASILDRSRRDVMESRTRAGFRGTDFDRNLRDANGRLIGTPLPGDNTRLPTNSDGSTRGRSRFNDEFDWNDNNTTFQDR
jgi:hypothetical protein